MLDKTIKIFMYLYKALKKDEFKSVDLEDHNKIPGGTRRCTFNNKKCF